MLTSNKAYGSGMTEENNRRITLTN